jgi:uncharacterized spore protein YtfJ
MSLERLFDTLEGLRSSASVDAAFGKPQEAEGRFMIPVSSVQVGMGMGFGREVVEESPERERASDEIPTGGGGGGGAGARPIAMIEVSADETIIHPIVDETKVSLAGIALGAWMFFLLAVTIRRVFSGESDAE